MKELGIQSSSVYPELVTDTLPFEDAKTTTIHNAKFFQECVISLPMHSSLTDEEVQVVIDTITVVELDVVIRRHSCLIKKVDLLRECLERFETQTVSNFEVVVVSDGCEEVFSFLDSYEAKFPLSYFNTNYEGFGVALAKNKGIYEAKGEQIIIISLDCLVTSNFIESHQLYFEQGLLVAGDIVTVELDDFDCEEVIMGKCVKYLGLILSPMV